MKLTSLLAALLMSVSIVQATDLSFAFEGSEKQRERLSELQGSSELPALSVTNWVNSAELKIADLKGKIVILDFWATWCGPCIRSIPHANKIHEKYKDDVVFIGVCHPRGSEKMKDMVASKGIKYPVAIDPDSKTINAYKVNGYPDYYIIGKDGKLLVADCKNGSVDAVLEKLLAK